jgi:hypothetical protein
MKKVLYKGRFIFLPIGVAAILSLVSYVVMQLWNNLLPGILHVGVVTFWQAMGIFILCKILFGFGGGKKGGFGGGGGPWMRHRMEEKLKHMSPDQQERFKTQMKNRFCGPGMRGWRSHNWGDDATAEKETPKA